MVVGSLPPLKCNRTGKIVHRNARGAKLAARRMKEKTGDILTVYTCPNCHGWHIGHTPIWKQHRAKGKKYSNVIKLRYRNHGQ